MPPQEELVSSHQEHLKPVRALPNTHDYILQVNIMGNPQTTFICCYSPHHDYSDATAKEFYQELTSAVEAVPAYNLLMIGGDLNAHLVPGDALFTYSE